MQGFPVIEHACRLTVYLVLQLDHTICLSSWMVIRYHVIVYFRLVVIHCFMCYFKVDYGDMSQKKISLLHLIFGEIGATILCYAWDECLIAISNLVLDGHVCVCMRIWTWTHIFTWQNHNEIDVLRFCGIFDLYQVKEHKITVHVAKFSSFYDKIWVIYSHFKMGYFPCEWRYSVIYDR